MSKYLDYHIWHELSRRAIELAIKTDVKNFVVNYENRIISYDRDFDGYVISGMGGSGIVGDIIRDLAYDRIDKNIIVIKDFTLPRHITKGNYLIFSISYSGNTRETIDFTLKALKHGLPIIAITTDGVLEKLCRKYNIPLINVPKATAPRYGLPSLLYSTLTIISSYEKEIISNEEINESIEVQKQVINEVELVRSAAHSINGKIPLIYVPSPIASVGLRFKNDLNENAKVAAIVAVFPESEHNDITIHMLKHDNVIPIVVTSSILNTEYQIHTECIINVIRSYNYDPLVVELKGKYKLSVIMYGITLLGLISLELAYIRGINPIVIEPIDRIKNELSKKLEQFHIC